MMHIKFTANTVSKFSIALFSLLLLFSLNTAYALDDSTYNKLTTTNIEKVLNQACEKFKNDKGGKNADYIKALAEVDSNLFGITIVTVDGKIYKVGDYNSKFSIQSISKVLLSRKPCSNTAQMQYWKKLVPQQLV